MDHVQFSDDLNARSDLATVHADGSAHVVVAPPVALLLLV